MLKATGLEWRQSDGGWRAYWRAPKRAVSRGYRPALVRIPFTGDPSEAAVEAVISDHCNRLRGEVLAFLDRNGAPRARRPDGTLGALIDQYQTAAFSPFQRVKWNTQRAYLHDLSRLKAGVGERSLATIVYEDIYRWYEAARKPKPGQTAERVRSARGLMTMLRIVIGFGILTECADCKRIAQILDEATWEAPKPRRVHATLDDAKRVIEKACELGAYSIALGQALQFEGLCRQEDVTGQWQPLKAWEVGEGPLYWAPQNERWVNGLTWSHLDAKGILDFETGKTGRRVIVDINLYPLLKREIDRVPDHKRVGPMIVDERSEIPYRPKEYSKRWRKIARLAGVSDNVWNRDSRAGGISEGREAGAPFEDIAKQAGHANPAITAKVYDRSEAGPAQRLAGLRISHRKTG